MRIYFECGKLIKDSQLPLENMYAVNAKDGAVSNYNALSIIKELVGEVNVYTNSPLVLDKSIAWNESDKSCNILIRDINNNMFKPIVDVIAGVDENSDLLKAIIAYYMSMK